MSERRNTPYQTNLTITITTDQIVDTSSLFIMCGIMVRVWFPGIPPSASLDLELQLLELCTPFRQWVWEGDVWGMHGVWSIWCSRGKAHAMGFTENGRFLHEALSLHCMVVAETRCLWCWFIWLIRHLTCFLLLSRDGVCGGTLCGRITPLLVSAAPSIIKPECLRNPVAFIADILDTLQQKRLVPV